MTAVEDVGTAARRGVLVLAARQCAIQAINMVATIVLARLLDPSTFGAYAIVMAILVTVTAFGDLGLGASLLQQGGAISPGDLHRNFTVTLLAVGGLIAVFSAAVVTVAALAPALLGRIGVAILLAAAVPSLWWAFRAPAAVQYESALDYRRLAVVELSESILFQAVAVAAAAAGLGVWSFIIALNARAFVGSMWLYWTAPVRPRLTRALQGVGHHIRFGVKYQLGWMAQSAASLALPLAVAPSAGTRGLGYYLNANNNATRLNVFVDLLARVGLPALSRAQQQPGRASRPESAILRVLTFALLGWAALMASQAEAFTVVLFGARWSPAVPLLQVLAFGAVSTAVTWVCGTAAASAGRPDRQGLLLSVRLALMFPAFLVAGHLFGVLGVAWASLAVETVAAAAGLALLGWTTARTFIADVLHLLPATGVVFIVEALLPSTAPTLVALVGHAFLVGVVYVAVALALHPLLRREIGRLRDAVRPGPATAPSA